MEYWEEQRHIGLDAIVFSLYIASSPIHQILVLSNGGTITKYLALATMIICLVSGLGRFHFDQSLMGRVVVIAIWFSFTMIWSRSVSTTFSSLISIFSYFALLLVVGSKEWADREKQLFSAAFLISVVVFSVMLIQSASTMRRATIVWSESEREADQNVLAMNIGMGIPFAVHFFLNSKSKLVRILMIMISLLIVAGIIATGSRGGMISVASALVYYLLASRDISIQQRMRTILIFALISLTVYIVISRNLLNNESIVARFTSSAKDTSGRKEIWSQYLEILRQRPRGIAVGYGYGVGLLEYGDFFKTKWPPATHQDVLYIVTGTGIAGLALCMWLVIHIWKHSWRIGNHLGCACMILMLVAGLSVDIFSRYGWWNAMIFAYIGIGVRHEIAREMGTP